MMVMVQADHFVRPLQDRLVNETRGLRASIDANSVTIAPCEPSKIAFAIGQPQQGLLALAHDDYIDAELAQGGAWSRRAVRSDGNQRRCERAKRERELPRHT